MKKRKLNTWKSTTKTLKVKINENVVELKEDRSLFARMCVVAKSRPEIDLKEAIGQYEFNLVPRSMFAADESMLHCSSKSVLMNILEKLNSTPPAENTVSQNSSRLQQPPVQKQVCIIRDLKHRQRNGTTTTGGSKIFPREGSAHVRCCQNVV